MGHMDVVPVVEGTEGDWNHDAYSGHVDDTYIWGRGSVDMKDQVAGELEAAEYALAHGWRLRRPLILAFGQDEECLQSGAKGLSRVLQERDVRLAFVVDEGTYLVEDAAGYGAPGLPVMGVGLAEKGYADIELTVRSAGGHSSNPFGGTSLGILSEAITRIVRAPWPVALTGLDQATFAAVADAVTDPRLAPLVAGGPAGIAVHADEIAQVCLADRDLNPLVVTTVAPTVIEGSSQANNVMPQDMRAVINFRILETTNPPRSRAPTARASRRSRGWPPATSAIPRRGRPSAWSPSCRPARPTPGPMSPFATPACAFPPLWSTRTSALAASMVRTSASRAAPTCRASAS